jgi:hypothetical protein
MGPELVRSTEQELADDGVVRLTERSSGGINGAKGKEFEVDGDRISC